MYSERRKYFTTIVRLSLDSEDPFGELSRSFAIKDIPYLAVCSLTEAEGIWTHDPHFMEQKRCKIFTNIGMLKASGRVHEQV